MAITAIIDICRLMSNMAIGLAIIKMSAILGMLVFRHKTRHWYFRVVALLGLCWQLALYLWLRFGLGV